MSSNKICLFLISSWALVLNNSCTNHDTPGKAPDVHTLEATFVHPTGVTFNGSVNPNLLSTTITFEYGTTTSYGLSVAAAQSPVSGDSTIHASATITYLPGSHLGQIWHFRIIAENERGKSVGEDIAFKVALFQGGELVYIFKPGDHGYDPNIVHGLVRGPVITGPWVGELGSSGPWVGQNSDGTWNPNIEIGTTSTAMGTGKTNTEMIVANLGDGVYAAKMCYDLVYNGYDDWFLPSLDELKAEDDAFPGQGCSAFCISYFWSSSELYKEEAWYFAYGYLGPGYSYYAYKDNGFGIKAFRYF